MVTGYNQNDWGRLLAGEYDRPPDVPDYECMEDTLYMGELVEPLGFDSIWATEHYGSAYSMQPNPLQWLAYWAGRTQRVDVGTAVLVAPWWNPIRLAAQLSMLDVLLRGRRMHLGFGRGVAPHEYASLNLPQEESHKYFYDVINAIRAADGSQNFTYDGEIFKIPPSTIRPQGRNFGNLTKNMKAAFSTNASARLAAQNGMGQMFTTDANLEEMTKKVREFNEIRAELGLPPDQPTTLLWMYCAETAEEAADGAKYYVAQSTSARHHYYDWKNSGFNGVKGMEEYVNRSVATDAGRLEGIQSRLAVQPIGTPAQIIEKIRMLQQTISLEKIVLHVFYGGMPRDVAEKSLRLFAKEVLPAIQAMDTPINPSSLGRAVV